MRYRHRARLVWVLENVVTAPDAIQIPAVRFQLLDQISALHLRPLAIFNDKNIPLEAFFCQSFYTSVAMFLIRRLVFAGADLQGLGVGAIGEGDLGGNGGSVRH